MRNLKLFTAMLLSCLKLLQLRIKIIRTFYEDCRNKRQTIGISESEAVLRLENSQAKNYEEFRKNLTAFIVNKGGSTNEQALKSFFDGIDRCKDVYMQEYKDFCIDTESENQLFNFFKLTGNINPQTKEPYQQKKFTEKVFETLCNYANTKIDTLLWQDNKAETLLSTPSINFRPELVGLYYLYSQDWGGNFLRSVLSIDDKGNVKIQARFGYPKGRILSCMSQTLHIQVENDEGRYKLLVIKLKPDIFSEASFDKETFGDYLFPGTEVVSDNIGGLVANKLCMQRISSEYANFDAEKAKIKEAIKTKSFDITKEHNSIYNYLTAPEPKNSSISFFNTKPVFEKKANEPIEHVIPPSLVGVYICYKLDYIIKEEKEQNKPALIKSIFILRGDGKADIIQEEINDYIYTAGQSEIDEDLLYIRFRLNNDGSKVGTFDKRNNTACCIIQATNVWKMNNKVQSLVIRLFVGGVSSLTHFTLIGFRAEEAYEQEGLKLPTPLSETDAKAWRDKVSAYPKSNFETYAGNYFKNKLYLLQKKSKSQFFTWNESSEETFTMSHDKINLYEDHAKFVIEQGEKNV